MEKDFEPFEKFANNLKEEFKNIFEELSVPNDERYIFNEYFSYIEYPSYGNFKNKFILSNENKEKYPLIEQYIKNESGPKKLKYLFDYNDFLNSMINYYSGKIARNEANKQERTLDLEEIYKNDENFRNKFDKFKLIWNDHLSTELKENIIVKKNDKFKEKFDGNERLAYFLNDNDEKGYGIFISIGLFKFIEWQNSFLKPIIEAYKTKKKIF